MISRSRAAPSAPVSEKPAVSTTAARTPRRPALFEQALDLGSTDGEQRQVGRLGQIGEAWVGLHPEEHSAARVDRVDGAGVAPVEDVAQGGSAPLPDVVGSADDGHGIGREHGLQVGLERADRRRRSAFTAEDDEGVGGHRPVSGDEKRVDVDLGHFGEVDCDAGQRLDHGLEPRSVDRRGAAERPQQLPGPDEIGELGDVALAKGDDSERDIAQHLGQHSTEAEGDDRSEHGVALQAREQFPVALDHLLDEDALEGFTGPAGDEPVRFGDRVRVAGGDTQQHQAALGLVVDGGADRLHGHAAADAGRRVRPPRPRSSPRAPAGTGTP